MINLAEMKWIWQSQEGDFSCCNIHEQEFVYGYMQVAHDGKDVFFLIQVPGAYVYKSE
jgi:hypothetical protein